MCVFETKHVYVNLGTEIFFSSKQNKVWLRISFPFLSPKIMNPSQWRRRYLALKQPAVQDDGV